MHGAPIRVSLLLLLASCVQVVEAVTDGEAALYALVGFSALVTIVLVAVACAGAPLRSGATPPGDAANAAAEAQAVPPGGGGATPSSAAPLLSSGRALQPGQKIVWLPETVVRR